MAIPIQSHKPIGNRLKIEEGITVCISWFRVILLKYESLFHILVNVSVTCSRIWMENWRKIYSDYTSKY